MDSFLNDQKQAARERGWRWKLVAAGPRDKAFEGFRYATRHRTADLVVLLVDAEAPVQHTPRDHLRNRDGWDLRLAEEESIHLMVQTMEAWIVADPEALATYYGQGFQWNALPDALDLESVPKAQIERGLKAATTRTRKGAYHKIRHATELLAKIDPARVQDRCPGCVRLLDYLGKELG